MCVQWGFAGLPLRHLKSLLNPLKAHRPKPPLTRGFSAPVASQFPVSAIVRVASGATSLFAVMSAEPGLEAAG
jgi:hypothetical protein